MDVTQSVVRGYSLLIPSYLVGLHSTWMLLKVWLDGRAFNTQTISSWTPLYMDVTQSQCG